MPWFQFLIHGENYRFVVDGKPEIGGFYTTRNFKTETLEQAKELAYKSIREDKTLNARMDKGIEPMPTIYLEEIYELEGKPRKVGRWPFATRRGKGFTFYFGDDENEEE